MRVNQLCSKIITLLLIILSVQACGKKDEQAIVKPLAVGDDYEGGIIAYLFKSGDSGYIEGQTHGIVVSRHDQSTGMIWGCWSTSISGADFTELGKGDENTSDIIVGCTSIDIAARLCSNYESKTYSDWFLPSKDELNKLYLNKTLIQDLDNTNQYWSSSESDNNEAMAQDFLNGRQYSQGKLSSLHVRAIRNF